MTSLIIKTSAHKKILLRRFIGRPDGEKIFLTHISDEGVVSERYEKCTQLNKKKSLKCRQQTSTSQKKIYKWSINTWKYAQH